VLAGDYPAGQRLVTRKLAREIGGSLNPVREAIGRLAAEGLIDHVPGAGAFVKAARPEELLELYELRQAIEPFAARKAASTITEAELGLLADLCAEMYQLALQLRESGGHLEGAALDHWLSSEERFHETLVRAARNQHFNRTIAHYRVLTRLFHGHRALGVLVDLRVVARTWASHSRLVRALVRKDGETAAALTMESLVRGARHALG
jgi:DNA-binding GntR family transcriptional regulator